MTNIEAITHLKKLKKASIYKEDLNPKCFQRVRTDPREFPAVLKCNEIILD
jgi:hypothetical protein